MLPVLRAARELFVAKFSRFFGYWLGFRPLSGEAGSNVSTQAGASASAVLVPAPRGLAVKPSAPSIRWRSSWRAKARNAGSSTRATRRTADLRYPSERHAGERTRLGESHLECPQRYPRQCEVDNTHTPRGGRVRAGFRRHSRGGVVMGDEVGIRAGSVAAHARVDLIDRVPSQSLLDATDGLKARQRVALEGPRHMVVGGHADHLPSVAPGTGSGSAYTPPANPSSGSRSNSPNSRSKYRGGSSVSPSSLETCVKSSKATC